MSNEEISKQAPGYTMISNIFLVVAVAFSSLAITNIVRANDEIEEYSETPFMSDYTEIHSLHEGYSDVESLSKKAESILEVKIVSAKVSGGGLSNADSDETTTPITTYQARVLSATKGTERAGEEIVFSVLGGTAEGREFIVDGAPKITVNEKYMIFGTKNSSAQYVINAGGKAIAPMISEDSYSIPESVFYISDADTRVNAQKIDMLLKNGSDVN